MIGRRLLPATVAALALLCSPALAADPAPDLTLQSSFSPPDGIARTDFPSTNPTPTGLPHATAVDGDRIYSVGETQPANPSSSTSGEVAILARHRDGTLDTSFSDDGELVIDLSAAEDTGIDIAVLPDHRVRILAVTGTNSTIDTALIGLNADGSPDTSFGGAGGSPSGIETLGRAPDTPAAIALAPDGRIAVTGDDGGTGNDHTFVTMLNADGTPVTTFGAGGTVVLNPAEATIPDKGMDVAFRPGGGVIVLSQVGANGAPSAVLHALTDVGTADPAFGTNGDLALAVGDPPTQPEALLEDGGRIWVTGSTHTGVDTKAFLARVEADGSGLQSRQFDLRGSIDPSQAVTSEGSNLTIAPAYNGTPRTLVVVGSVQFGSSPTTTDWAAAAFNDIDGDLAAAGYGDIVIPASPGPLMSVAASGDGAVSITGSYRETVTTPSSSTTYTRFGDARLLIDADKTCNLNLKVSDPLELTVAPGALGSLSFAVANGGTRACGGSISVPGPYFLSRLGAVGPLSIGAVAAGASTTVTDAQLGYFGPPHPSDFVTFTLDAPGDSDLSDNTAALHVRFSYCDAGLSRGLAASFIPNQGSRRFDLVTRNAGTTACSKVRVGVSGDGRRAVSAVPYAVQAGKSVSDEVPAISHAAKVGTPMKLVFRVAAPGDVNAANNSVTMSPVLLGVGDSNASRPRGAARLLHGTASPGHGPAKARLLRVTRVSVAVQRVGGGCRWLTGAAAKFRKSRPDAKGRCLHPVWLKATGTRHWHLATRGLPAGRYVLLSRATIGAGFPEAVFSAKDRNRVAFRVAR